MNYTVQPGDTLFLIARRFGITVNDILAANPQITNPNVIFVGQIIFIPTSTPIPPTPPPFCSNGFFYVVVPGDTMSAIAQRFGVTLTALINANPQITNPNVIFPGQRICVPVKPPTTPPPPVTCPLLRRGNTGTDVVRLQQLLVRAGFNPGPIDGIFGPLTEAAVIAAQRRSVLLDSGVVDVATWQALGVACKHNLTSFAYLVGTGTTGPGFDAMVANSNLITHVGVFDFQFNDMGQIVGTVNPLLIQQIHALNMKAHAVITNITPTPGGNFSGTHAHTVLSDPNLRATLISNIKSFLINQKYDGVNIDFEFVFPEDRTLFNTFISELSVAIRPQFIFSLSVPAKTSDMPTNPFSGFVDYSALAPLVDFMVVLTQDEHAPGGPPGPIASIPFIQAVMNFVLSRAPKEKVYLIVPLYGRDWRIPQNTASTVTNQTATALAATFGATITFNNTFKEPMFRYTSDSQQHEVWFQNATCVRMKLELADILQLPGVGIWNLNLSFHDFWNIIRSLFNVRKDT